MKYFVVILTFLAVASGLPLDLVEDGEGEQYYLLPLHRERRQTKWGVSDTGFGASHTGTILSNSNHRLDGTGYAGKNFGSHGLTPDQVGGRLDYQHMRSGSTAFVGADHTRHMGTDVNVGAKYNIYQRKNLDVGLTGQYGRHFGGAGGTGRPNAGVFLGATGRF